MMTREQATAWLTTHEREISVREVVGGQWRTVRLHELPEELRARWRRTLTGRLMAGLPVPVSSEA